MSVSLVPFPAHQRHTFAVGDAVYEAEYRELAVVAPDGASVDLLRNRLSWPGAKGAVQSTAREVVEMARARASGFRIVRA
ncbi:MAG: hypothetical protein ABGY75_14520 [Gemmataceae bacterium]